MSAYFKNINKTDLAADKLRVKVAPSRLYHVTYLDQVLFKFLEWYVMAVLFIIFVTSK